MAEPLPLRALYESSPTATGILREGKFAHANPALLRRLGLADGTGLSGRPLAEFLSPAASADGKSPVLTTAQALDHCLQHGHFEGEWNLVTGERPAEAVQVRLEVLEGGAGQDIAIYVFEVRIKQSIMRILQSGDLRLFELAHNAPFGIFLTDAEGRAVYLNRRVAEFGGISPDDIMGEGWKSILHPDDAHQVTRRWMEFITRKDRFSERFRYLSKSGKVTWVHARGAPIHDADGATIGFYGSITAVDEQVRVEEELKRSRNEALQANEAKTRFLSSMSHELRTPMNAILGFAQLLQLNNANLSREQNLAVEHILDSGEHLLKLIEEVLDLSRIDSGHIELKLTPVLLEDAIERALALIEPLARQARIRLVAGAVPAVQVLADPLRLQQVLVNLLSNAIKYNREEGSVNLEVDLRSRGRLRIHVRDTGMGIDPRHWSRLFRPFERAVDSGSRIEGTGIGLSLSKQLVELMGGSVGFDSTPGRGSNFWVELTTLPGSPAEPGDGFPSLTRRKDSRLRMLYIEDQPRHLDFLEEVARHINCCDLESATTAADGLARARRHPPDLILLNIDLADATGVDAVKVLRNDERTSHVPLIGLASDGSSALVQQGLEAGLARCLTRPLRLQELFAAMDELAGPQTVAGEPGNPLAGGRLERDSAE